MTAMVFTGGSAGKTGKMEKIWMRQATDNIHEEDKKFEECQERSADVRGVGALVTGYTMHEKRHQILRWL
jgi:hypothetical protein